MSSSKVNDTIKITFCLHKELFRSICHHFVAEGEKALLVKKNE